MKTVKEKFKKIFGESAFVSLVKIKRKLFKLTYLEREKIRMFCKALQESRTEKYRSSIKKTIKEIENNKGNDYIIFHNPMFLGVTSATKELFDYLVPAGDIYRKKDINLIVNTILENDIKKVYFSAFCYNWKKIVIKLKKANPDIICKTYWHGSHSQILDTFGWNRNMEIIDLHRKGYIDEMATCKESIIKFYDANNFKSIFLSNNVNFDGANYVSKEKNKNIKLGIYSANTDWRKNMMCQVGAAKLIKNAVIDMVPLNPEAKKLADLIGVKMEGLKKPVPREEILARMAKNDINLYGTFSECAPMVPLESLEVGVPCISGNNHHFFQNTPLEKYLILNNETDIEELKEKIELCIKEKETILKLYQEWKIQNDKFTKDQVKKFIGGDTNE